MFRPNQMRFWPFRLLSGAKRNYLVFLLLLLIIPVLLPVKASNTSSTSSTSSTSKVHISVNGISATGILHTQLSTNDVWSGMLTQVPGAQAELNAYHPPLVRIHAGTDGWPGALPEIQYDKWDFSPLNNLVNNVRAYGGVAILNVRYAPNWMWTCNHFGGVGQLKDVTFQTFATYMARLVSYYNKGSMITETGQVITNPAGTTNRITYWELWNEPDYSNETPCHPANWSASLTPSMYVKMWNAVVPQMRAIDPTIKLVGPATANVDTGYTPEYIPTLIAHANYQPDAISYHGYGGWDNTQTDSEIFDGGPDTGGLAYIVNGVNEVKQWAPGKPIWITELNVNAAWGDDPHKRPWTAYGVAWGATAFRNLALQGVSLMNQYDVIESAQFGLISDTTGVPYLPYWRDRLLSQAFPASSTILSTNSTQVDILPLAVRKPDGTISVLVINRQVNSSKSVGGSGLPATVTVQLQGITPTAISLQKIDSATNPAKGPTTVSLSLSTMPQVSFTGYGIAVLSISTKHSSATPTSTPTNAVATPPTPTPTNAAATPPPTPTSTSGANLILYDNAVSSAFTDNSFNYYSRNPCDNTAYVSAPCSYAITYQAYGAIEFILKNGSINPNNYKSLDYAINTSGQPIADFGIVLSGSAGNWINEVALSTLDIHQALPGGWVYISLPLSQLDPAHIPIETIDLENVQHTSMNIIYVDDVRFVV